MFKKILMILALAAPAACGAAAQEPAVSDKVENVAETGFSAFSYQGFDMLVPAGSQVEMTGKEAVLKTDDRRYGLSLKIETEADASPEAAVQLCSRMISELNIKNAQLNRVMIHGMAGGRLQGTIEGALINVVVLDASRRYVKLIIITSPDLASWADRTIDSLAPTR